MESIQDKVGFFTIKPTFPPLNRFVKMRKSILLLIFLLLSASTWAQVGDTVVNESEDDAFQIQLIRKMDNMLDLWYIKMQNNRIKATHVVDSDADIVLSDSLLVERLKGINTMIPLAYNDVVKRWIELYVVKRKKSSAVLMGLAQYYYPYMQEIFDKYDVPEELIYLTIIESGLNPTAISPMGATGIWQFMHGTGKAYGLEVNTFVDDRRDPMKATDAAARHLRDLYNIFNDWGLAISAYNCGAGNVRKAITRSGGKTDFWGVKSYLPRETQNYFPAYIAALYLATYHKQHGIPAAQISIPFSVDTVMINHEVHLQQIAEVLEIDMEELTTLNPQYKRNVIPAYSDPYPLRMQNRDLIRFLELKDSIYAYKYEEFFTPIKVYAGMFTGEQVAASDYKKTYHTVKSKESLASIARKYGLSVNELKQMNNLKSNYIKPKQRLLVGYEYIKPQVETTDSLAVDDTVGIDSLKTTTPSDTVVAQKKNPTPSNSPKIHTVKKGDTMSSIARKYGLTAKQLADYNKITNINAIQIGQKLKIPPR